MAVTVRIPTPLMKVTAGQSEVQTQGTTVAEVLSALNGQFPGLKDRLYDEHGKLRRFVNIFVNEEDIRFLQGEQTTVKDGDEVSIIPAIAGGAIRQVTLIYPQHLIKAPVLFTMAKQFGVTPNIRRAKVTETVGEITLELEGSEEALTRGLDFLRHQGITVEPVTGDNLIG